MIHFEFGKVNHVSNQVLKLQRF